MIDYRDIYKSQSGACATCVNVRTVIRSKNPSIDEDQLAEYDGGKYAACARHGNSAVSIVMRDTPNIDLTAQECWEPIKPIVT